MGARFALNSQWKMRTVLPSARGRSLVLGRGTLSTLRSAFSTSAISDRLIALTM